MKSVWSFWFFGRGEGVEVAVVPGVRQLLSLSAEAVMASEKRHSLNYYNFGWTYRA
jgi:hypothetical protein